MSHDTFERMGFEDLVVMEDLHLAQLGVNADGYALTFPLHTHSVVLQIQTDGARGVDFALEMFPMP